VHGLCDVTGRAFNPGAAQIPPGGSSESESDKLVTIKVGKADCVVSSIRKPEAIFEGRVPPQKPETEIQRLFDKTDEELRAARG
jgi:hypothetical protein